VNIPVARAASQFQRERWEEQLREVEAEIEKFKSYTTRPVRHELERLGKRKLELMRKLGMI
jgi:hypothetical protein